MLSCPLGAGGVTKTSSGCFLSCRLGTRAEERDVSCEFGS